MIYDFDHKGDPVRVEFAGGQVWGIQIQRWEEINEADDEWADIVEAAHEHVRREKARKQ